MVFDASDSINGRVHCRLSWSADPLASAGSSEGWKWVDEGGLTGRDFIPLGTSAAAPTPPPCAYFRPVVNASSGKPLSDCDSYRNGLTPVHTMCAGSRSVQEDQDLESCQKTCESDGSCVSVQWQGQRAYNFSASSPGRCFLVQDSCTSQARYDYGRWKDFCMEVSMCQRAPSPSPSPAPKNEFDSHVCFAAAQPVHVDGMERVYYMGGNGPHSGERNSSFALATLRADGFAGVSGSGSATSMPLKVTGDSLTVTVDFLGGHSDGQKNEGYRDGDAGGGDSCLWACR